MEDSPPKGTEGMWYNCTWIRICNIDPYHLRLAKLDLFPRRNKQNRKSKVLIKAIQATADLEENAVLLIQTYFRMYLQRKKFRPLCKFTSGSASRLYDLDLPRSFLADIKHVHRTRVARELLTTEESYVLVLNSLVKVCIPIQLDAFFLLQS